MYGHLFQKELNNDNPLVLMQCLLSKENIKKANICRDKKYFTSATRKEDLSGMFSSDRSYQLIAQIIKENSPVGVQLTSLYECLFK